MHVATPFSLLLLLQRGHRCRARPENTACLTQRKCDARRQQLRLAQFSVGDYPTKGCFYKRGRPYFGRGGSQEDRSVVSLPGEQKRIWCNRQAPSTSETPARAPTASPETRGPTTPPARASPSRSACTENVCGLRCQELGLAKYKVDDYLTKGCFSKGDTVYFGTGGTAADEVTSPLAGEKQRLWCDIQTQTQGITTETCIDIRVTTELYGRKAGVNLSAKPGDNSHAERLLEFPVGSLESESEHAKRVCDVPTGTCTLAVTGRVSYSARVDGQEVLSGFNDYGKSKSHDILIGYNPILSDNEKAWVDAHNTRRAAFHEQHGREYRPLRWSAELARHAAEWAEKLLPNCAAVSETNIEEGELIAVNKGRYRLNSPKRTEAPENILQRWSDTKLDRSYPENQTLTQVMWRATRYVGCVTKFVERDDQSSCHVSVCRYSRAGTCSTSAVNWLARTLDEHSLCGTACPEEGCH